MPEVPSISWDGLCTACARKRRDDNNEQLIAHNGPWFEHWRRRSALAVGALLVDDLEALLPPDA